MSRIPWAYVFPVIVFFALGALRALVWVIILLLALVTMDFFFAANEHVVLNELKLRFYLSFLMVIMASFLFERLKRKYQMELIDNQQNLMESENKYRIAYEQLNREMKERQRAQDALRESEERFREMAELMPQAVFETDITGKLTFANRKAFDNFGYSQQDFDRGVNSLDILVPEDHQQAGENITKIMGGEEIGLNEYTALRKDGRNFPAMVHSATIVREGKTLGIRGFIIDITDRKKAEEERRKLETQFHQAQKLETIGTLAGGIAHDFNNLMTTILGNTSLILYDLDDTHPHYEPLNNIERQIKRGAELTTQLLGYARKGKYYVKPVNLNQIVEENAATFGRTRKEITIRCELADDLLAVEADQGQIQQVLLNLFVNAADAMPTGGNLILKTSNATHHDIKSKEYHPEPGDYLCLTVSDTGIGMDEKVQDKIDLVILDIVMPDMGGGDVYDRLKEINPDVKVLLASGYSIDDQAREIMERGCDDFIQKPFSLKSMSEKISGILSKKRGSE